MNFKLSPAIHGLVESPTPETGRSKPKRVVKKKLSTSSQPQVPNQAVYTRHCCFYYVSQQKGAIRAQLISEQSNGDRNGSEGRCAEHNDEQKAHPVPVHISWCHGGRSRNW